MSLYDWENHFLGVFLGKHYCLAWRFEKASEKKRGGSLFSYRMDEAKG